MPKTSKRRSKQRQRPYRMSRTMTDESKVVRFRLVDNNTSPATQSSTAGGVLAGYQNADPSGGGGATWQASEWTTLTALYSQVRLVQMKISFFCAPQEDTKLGGITTGNALFISSVLSSVSAAPTTSSQVFDNADAKSFNLLSNRSKEPITFTLRPRGKLEWAVVTTPNPGSYAGCPGAIQWYADTLPVSIVIMAIKTEGIYEFRSRI